MAGEYGGIITYQSIPEDNPLKEKSDGIHTIIDKNQDERRTEKRGLFLFLIC